MSLSSATEGVLLGLFLAGLLFPWIGNKGAISGACTSLLIMGWLVGGTQWHILNNRIHYPSLPTSVEDCPYPLNETLTQESATVPPLAPEDEPMILYHIGIFYFTLIGGFIVIFIGAIISYFTGEMDLSNVNPDHVSPIIRRLVDL